MNLKDIALKIGYPTKYNKKLSDNPGKFLNIDTNRMVSSNTKLNVHKKLRLASANASLLKKFVAYLKSYSSPKKSSPKRVVKPVKKSSPKKIKRSPKKVSFESAKNIYISPSPIARVQQRAIPRSKEKLELYVETQLDDYTTLTYTRYVLFHLTVLNYFNVKNENKSMTTRKYVELIKHDYNRVKSKENRLTVLSGDDLFFVKKSLMFLYSSVSHYCDD